MTDVARATAIGFTSDNLHLSDVNVRPVALDVLPEGIPAELKALPFWCCWRYEWNEQRGKWGKAPYTPYTTKHAASTRPSTLTSFERAHACYLERRDFFDGVFLAMPKDGPYVGGDFDNGCAGDRVPDTYAEYSPTIGKDGVRFIGKGTIPAACKKPNGELYSRARFLSFTGHKLPDAPADIRPIQPALDRLYTELKSASRPAREGSAGSGSRAELVKAIPESEWEAARHLARTQGDRLEARLRASAGEETQLAYLLRADYAGFHRKWSFAGILRADGSVDNSMVRAVVAEGIKGRGFTFPQYVVQMSRLFAASALAKWGTKEAWREELAALWNRAREPRYAHTPRKPAVIYPRGRAGNHADLVEKVYALLQDHRAGAQAIVKAGELAAALGVHRRTIVTVLNELRAAGRIESRPLGQHGGLVVTFNPGVIYSPMQTADMPHADAPNEVAPATSEETREKTTCVSSERATDHTSEAELIAWWSTQPPVPDADWGTPAELLALADELLAAGNAGAAWWIAHAVPPLADLAAYYLNQPATATGERLINRITGQITYRRSVKHFVLMVAAEASLVIAEYGYSAEEATAAYHAEQERRKQEAEKEWKRFFARLDGMSNDELITYVAGRCRTEVAELARDGSTFDKHLYATRLDLAKRQMKRRGLKMPPRKSRAQQQASQDAEQAAHRRRMQKVAQLEAMTDSELRAWVASFGRPASGTQEALSL